MPAMATRSNSPSGERSGPYLLAQVLEDPGFSHDQRLLGRSARSPIVWDATPAIDAMCALAMGGEPTEAKIALETLELQASHRDWTELDDPMSFQRCGRALETFRASVQDPLVRDLIARALLAIENRKKP